MNLQDEAAIVWLYDFDKADFPIVRQTWALNGSRTRAPRLTNNSRAVLVGYATLLPTASGEGKSDWGRARFWRRMFYAMPLDFQPERRVRDGKAPSPETVPRCEGVDPRTIQVGEPSQYTERCQVPTTPQQRALWRTILKQDLGRA